MPVLPGNNSYSPTVQSIANQLKSNPDFYNVLGGAAGLGARAELVGRASGGDWSARGRDGDK